MELIHLVKNKYIKIQFIGINWKSLLLVIAIETILLSFFEFEDNSMDKIVSIILGYISTENYNMFLSSLIKFMLPQIALLLVWGNYFDENILRNVNVIFTRTRQVEKVIRKYLLNVILGVTIMLVLFMGCLYVVYYIKGYRIQEIEGTISNCLLYIAYMNLLVVSVNLISLGIPVMYSVLSVFALQIACLQCTYMIQNDLVLEKLYYILPTSSIMMFINSETNSMIKLGWFVYLIGLLVVLYYIGCKIMKKKEFLP